MLRRTAVAGFVVLVTAACGGGPAAPSGATTFSPALLQTGPHVLTLEAGPPIVTAPLAAFLCVTFGAGAPTSAGVPLSLTVEGAGWRGSSHEGDLVLRLSRDGDVLSGTGRGRARTPGGVVVELGRATPTPGWSDESGREATPRAAWTVAFPSPWTAGPPTAVRADSSCRRTERGCHRSGLSAAADRPPATSPNRGH